MKSPLHICFLAPESYPVLARKPTGTAGGAEVQQVLLARELARRGHHVTMVVKDYGQKSREMMDGVAAVVAPFRYFKSFGGHPAYFPGDTVSLLRILKAINADVYVLKEPVFLLFALALLRKLSGKRIVKWCAHIRECRRADPGFARRRYLQPMRSLYLWGTHHTDLAIFQTDEQRALAARELGWYGPVIRNLLPDAPQAAEASPAKDFDVLWVGAMNPHKQPERLLDLAEALPDLRFCIVGGAGADRALYDRVQRRALALPNVTFVGFVPFDQVGDFFRRARLFVLTSECEGFSNVCLQAWQAAIPVVSLQLDPDGIIATHQLGMVAGNPMNLVSQVQRLAADESRREALGRNGRRYYERYHSSEVLVPQYVNAFRGVPFAENAEPEHL